MHGGEGRQLAYESLKHIFYRNPERWKAVYEARYRSPFARHLPLSIRQVGRAQVHPAFYCYPEELVVLQDTIRTSFQSCMRIIEQVPQAAVGQFLHHALIEEIQSTNEIEGVRSTRREILQALEAPPAEQRSYRLGSIVRKYLRILQGERVPLCDSHDIRALYDDFIADEIRRDDPRNLPDGRIFRRESVDILSAGQKVLHRGVYPEETVIGMMDQALAVLNDASLPILVRIAIFHYFFGYIHPFYDGNGRMSRFITSYLLAQEFHPTVALRVSIYIKQHRKQYYELFSTTDDDRNGGDLTPFALGMMRFIAGAMDETCALLSSRQEEYESTWKRIAPQLVNKTTRAVGSVLLQAAIFSDIGASIRELCTTLQKTENTIHAHIDKLPAGLVYIDKTMRPYRYRINIEKL